MDAIASADRREKKGAPTDKRSQEGKPLHYPANVQLPNDNQGTKHELIDAVHKTGRPVGHIDGVQNTQHAHSDACTAADNTEGFHNIAAVHAHDCKIICEQQQ